MGWYDLETSQLVRQRYVGPQEYRANDECRNPNVSRIPQCRMTKGPFSGIRSKANLSDFEHSSLPSRSRINLELSYSVAD